MSWNVVKEYVLPIILVPNLAKYHFLTHTSIQANNNGTHYGAQLFEYEYKIKQFWKAKRNFYDLDTYTH